MSLCPMSSWHRAVSLLKTVSLSLVAPPSPTPIYTACQPWSQFFDFLCRFHLPHILWRLIIVNDRTFSCGSHDKTAPTPPAGTHTWVTATCHNRFVLLFPSHALASTGGDCVLCLLFSLPSLNTWQKLSQLFDMWINLSNSIANLLRTPVIWSGGEDTEHR